MTFEDIQLLLKSFKAWTPFQLQRNLLNTVPYLTSIPWAVRFSWLENAYSRPLFSAGNFMSKVGQTDLVLVYDQGLLVGLCMQDYKCLCAGATIC